MVKGERPAGTPDRPSCPHDGVWLRWIEDQWYCPKCGDEFSTDVYPVDE